MKNKLTKWFSGLSTTGKVLAGTAAVATTGIVIAGAAPNETANVVDTPTPPPVSCGSETTTKTQSIPYKVTRKGTKSLDKGETEIQTPGVKGVRTLSYTVTYDADCNVKSKELESKEVTVKPINQVTLVGTYVEPKPDPVPTTSSSCDSNYIGGCVPVVSYDLDCPDIGFSVTVVGSDPHGFDGNGDGQGCEAY